MTELVRRCLCSFIITYGEDAKESTYRHYDKYSLITHHMDPSPCTWRSDRAKKCFTDLTDKVRSVIKIFKSDDPKVYSLVTSSLELVIDRPNQRADLYALTDLPADILNDNFLEPEVMFTGSPMENQLILSHFFIVNVFYPNYYRNLPYDTN